MCMTCSVSIKKLSFASIFRFVQQEKEVKEVYTHNSVQIVCWIGKVILLALMARITAMLITEPFDEMSYFNANSGQFVRRSLSSQTWKESEFFITSYHINIRNSTTL